MAQGLDVENVLFYNVGTSAFRALTGRMLRFERIAGAPPVPPTKLDFDARHYVRYHPVLSNARSHDADARPVVAEARIALRDVGEMKNLASLWRSFKVAMISGADRDSLIGKPFEIQLAIAAPAQCRPKLVEVMKPLIDAFISALHFYRGNQLDAVTSRLSQRLAAPPDLVRRLLLRSETAALGARAVPYLRGEGLQWSPADDLLVAGELRFAAAKADEAIEISGRVFAALTARP
jgi:hypothetical protein